MCTCRFSWKRKEQFLQKVDVKIYFSILKVSLPQKGLAFQIVVRPGEGVEPDFVCNFVILRLLTTKSATVIPRQKFYVATLKLLIT